jgi:hypothetical protein
MTNTDKLIREYAARLRDIYREQTAGDYTFEGALFQFLLAIDDDRAKAAAEQAKTPKSQVHLTGAPLWVEFVVSETDPNNTYCIVIQPDGTSSCTCPSFTYGARPCKHIRKVESRKALSDADAIRS